MQIEIQIDSAHKEPRIIILTDQMTEELSDLVKRLSEDSPQIVAGFREERVELLEPSDILRVYAAGGKVFAATARGEYMVRLRLYELEERLEKRHFVRISHSEIINLKKVRGFDVNLAGTIRVTLTNETVTYVSRRYVSKIKQMLGI